MNRESGKGCAACGNHNDINSRVIVLEPHWTGPVEQRNVNVVAHTEVRCRVAAQTNRRQWSWVGKVVAQNYVFVCYNKRSGVVGPEERRSGGDFMISS